MTQAPVQQIHCDCNIAHEAVRCGCRLAHAPAQVLADLLKAAVEVNEIASIVRVHAALTVEEQRRFDALRVAVKALEGSQ